MEAKIEAKTFPKTAKSCSQKPNPKRITISIKKSTFFHLIFDDYFVGVEVVFSFPWYKRMFKKQTKTLCFCVCFEDRLFWHQHQIFFKIESKSS